MAEQAEQPIRPSIDLENRREGLLNYNQRVLIAPTGSNLLGPTSVVGLVLNRTIGSGIFVIPALVAGGAGSAGGALMLWAFGGLISTCGLMVWLQLGLSLPLLPTGDDQCLRAVPRSGGEKNYLEFIYQSETRDRPKLLVKCMYGIAFIVLGNLSGNAIAFGIYVTSAAEHSPEKGLVIGIAIAALTVTALLNMLSSRVAIIFNNVFAAIKVALLLSIIVLGFMKAGNFKFPGKVAEKATSNFDTATSFKPGASEASSVSNSLLYILYTYSGFEQPFYVLTEVRKPRKLFPKWTLTAMALVLTLFLLVNVAYFCAVPWDLPALDEQRNMAIVFFGQVFGDDNRAARRAMDSIIAFSIFGNLLVMTYTASRVKQEIAKEGILPWSLMLATSHRTPLALLFGRNQSGTTPEEAPMAALVLHWFMSVMLTGVTAMLDPSTAYSALVTLYSYVIVILIGFFTSAGLLYLKFKRSRNWKEPNFNPPFGWLYAAVYAVMCAFMLFVAFAPPSDSSPYSYAAGKIKWFMLPAIGLSTPFWGVVWYAGLRLVMVKRGRKLVVERVPTTRLVKGEKDQYIMISEKIEHNWPIYGLDRDGPGASSMELHGEMS